jgi:hypothetical protein
VPKTLTAEALVVRKNPFMLRDPQRERGGIISKASTWPFVLSLVEGRAAIFFSRSLRAQRKDFSTKKYSDLCELGVSAAKIGLVAARGFVDGLLAK